MATVTGLTAVRMLAIENASIDAARIEGGHLIFTSHGGDDIDVGIVNGDNGSSAYELAVADGFVGTETDWLASLQGAPGNDGTSVTPATIQETLDGISTTLAVPPAAVATAVSTTGLAKIQFIPNGGTVTGSPGEFTLVVELGA